MSVLSFPRLYFRGTVSWDPIVSNNDPETYDGVNVRVHLNPGETTADFRKRMIATTQQRGDWNYFGTHTCVFEQTRVTGGELRPREGIRRDDALLYMPVELVGKLVDIDPAGICSQLFFDALSIGVAGRAHLRALPLARQAKFLTCSHRIKPRARPPYRDHIPQSVGDSFGVSFFAYTATWGELA